MPFYRDFIFKYVCGVQCFNNPQSVNKFIFDVYTMVDCSIIKRSCSNTVV